MDFYSIRELRSATKEICETLKTNGEAVVTNNGKPAVLMLDISGSNYELVIRAVRQAKAMIAFNEMRAIAAKRGYMTDAEIEAEIAAARTERKVGQSA
jgi:hypothetical protein